MSEDLDTLVRRVDEDRWLASRFAPEAVRNRLIAIYAVNYELARTPETVRELALGDIRLEWWRSALEDIHQGRSVRSHPALEAYARAVDEAPLSLSVFEALIQARRVDWAAQPFEGAQEFDHYIARTAGGVMRLAIEACGLRDGDAAIDRLVSDAGWLWGVTGLLRAEPVLRTGGRNVLPAPAEQLIRGAEGAFRALKSAQRPSSEIFPAIGYVSLAPGYLRALSKGRTSTPLLWRQLKLVVSSATGQL